MGGNLPVTLTAASPAKAEGRGRSCVWARSARIQRPLHSAGSPLEHVRVGTKKLAAEYGDRLVAVRYRYDEKTGARWKTVELIVEEVREDPGCVQPVPAVAKARVLGYEKELRDRVKEAGGRWRPDKCVWEVDYRRAREFGLESRIVEQERQHM